MKGFIQFVRSQGVVGLAVGFLLGGAVSKVVTALITDIVNPLISVAMGAAQNLDSATFSIGSTKILIGNFVSVVLDFIVVAAVVYFGVKMLGVDKWDKKKEEAPK